jgi:hypothetical protein
MTAPLEPGEFVSGFLAEAEDRRGAGMVSGIEGVQAQASQISRSLRETAAQSLSIEQSAGWLASRSAEQETQAEQREGRKESS